MSSVSGVVFLTVLHLTLTQDLDIFDIKGIGTKTLSPKNFRLPSTTTSSRNGNYSFETHDVVTEDGYILRMFRIVGAKNCNGERKKPPLILMHGLILSSDCWLDAGTDAGLGYILADECYDVWLGNVRGNFYSRRHVRLDPDTDAEFWQWSVDEIGFYDIPATIDYVLNQTGAEKVNYMGHSQGCGTFYIMCSERPGYCEKVQVFISLAPATRHLNTKSPIFRYLTEAINTFSYVLKALGIEEILPKGGVTQQLLEYLCASVLASNDRLCGSIPLDSYHRGSIRRRDLDVIRMNFPAGTSRQNSARYGQAMTSQDFVKFDYGFVKNLQLYGRLWPPAFNLGAVSVPVVILYGRADEIVDVKDIEFVAPRLPNVLEVFEVEDPQWNHFDMIYSQYIPQRILPKINEYLNRYTNE